MFTLLDDDPPAPAAGIIGADLLNEAAADQGGGSQTPGEITSTGPAAPVVIDYPGEARELVQFCSTIFFPLYPSLAQVYTDDARAGIAAALAPVMQKYGMSLGDIFGKWAPEIGLAIAVVPLMPATMAAIRADRAVREKGESNHIHAGQHDKQTNTGTPPPAAQSGGNVTNALLKKLAATEQQNGKRVD